MIKKLLKYLPENIRVLIPQMIRFLIVGVCNYALSYSVYAICIKIGLYYLVSNGISFCVGVLCSFIISQKVVFKGEGNLFNMLLKSITSYLFTGLLLQSILLAIWIEWCGIPALLAPFLNIAIITPINFIIQKFWVYR